MSAEFDINAHLARMNFGNQSSSSGGGSAAAEGISHEENLSKAVDKGVQTATKIVSSFVGLPINSDIEGKGALAGFDLQAHAGSMSLANAAIIKPESGGGWLSMLWELLKKHFTREIPSAVAAPVESGSASSGGSADSGGGSDGGGSATATAMAGGGDFHGHANIGAAEVPDMQVNYGGKIIHTEVADLGQLRPAATPVNGRTDLDLSSVSV